MAPWRRALCLVLFLLPVFASADPATFDLSGPTLEVKVTRGGKTLPISAVPNLAVGDQLWMKADLPEGQSVHYLLVACFLRGSTNPPPENWFYASETWKEKDRDGLRITVPKTAQQVLIFLAPETGGDFKTIIGAVRGRPGAFVRSSQDLNQATLDRARLKAYLAAIRKINDTAPEELPTASPLLARSLSMKLDPSCLEKIPELQAPCLMQGQESLILSDGHSTSVVAAVTSGNALDLAQQMSSTPQAGFGYYSPYIASVVDIARIMDSFHTAQYQYIPALATEDGDRLSLELNTPPSFHNPKSVLVVALPSVQPPQMPPLRPVDPKQVYCAEKTELVLPTEGAPLVFATSYARDMVLRLKGKNGKYVDLPVKADPEKGGFVANTAGLSPSNFGDVLDGSLHGYWGFEPYNGPEFRLENTHAQHWQIMDDQQALIAGQDATLHLATENAACVDSILLEQPTGDTLKADWKSIGPTEVAVTLPLKNVKPGSMKLLVKQYGSKDADMIPLQAFAPAGRLDAFTLHAGDTFGVLKGDQLDEVKAVALNGITFRPGSLTQGEGFEQLAMNAAGAKVAEAFSPGETATAKVTLKDGRVISLPTTIAAPRPAVTLIGKSIEPPASSDADNLQLEDQDELPRGGVLTFSIHAKVPASFYGDEKIEVATANGAYLDTLTTSNGLTLEDAQVALATLDTSKAFAPSASGPLRFRIVEDGVAGDWQPLATLVRLPVLRDLKCPESPDKPCKLTGSRLYLVDALATDPQFTHPVQVPVGYPGYTLLVPRPATGELYVKLHDDPAVVNTVLFPDSFPPAPAPVPVPQHPAAAANTPATGSAAQPAAATAPGSSSHVAPAQPGDKTPPPAATPNSSQSAPPPQSAAASPQPQTGSGPSASGSSLAQQKPAAGHDTSPSTGSAPPAAPQAKPAPPSSVPQPAPGPSVAQKDVQQ